jgi:hypothetical protein
MKYNYEIPNNKISIDTNIFDNGDISIDAVKAGLIKLGWLPPGRVDDILQKAINALEFYANPDTYFAIAFIADQPAGEFVDDFSNDHGCDQYERPMPGKMARYAIDYIAQNMPKVDEL